MEEGEERTYSMEEWKQLRKVLEEDAQVNVVTGGGRRRRRKTRKSKQTRKATRKSRKSRHSK